MKRRIIKYQGKSITCAESSDVFIWDGVSEVPKDVVKVKIKDGITEIRASAFAYRSELTDVIIPDSVTAIGENAFAYCSSLRTIHIPDSVRSIGVWAFQACIRLGTIRLPSKITTIGRYTFKNCIHLHSVILPDTLTTIEDCAFDNCEELTSIVIPQSVTHIGFRAFADCDRLTQVSIPEGVTGIHERAFEGSAYHKKFKSTTHSRSKYVEMRNAILNGEVEDLAYDSEYSDYIYEIYEKVMKSLNYQNLEILPSVQAGEGIVEAEYRDKDGNTVYAQWDYSDECEALEELVINNQTVSAFKGALKSWIVDKLTDAI